MSGNGDEDDHERMRMQMVKAQLAERGIHSEKTLDAFRKVPRDAFVPGELADLAYADGPLPIGKGQTISQPYIVATMIEALELRGDERVLEIGTGSGYAAALLSHIVKEVYTVERIESLATAARERLERLGFTEAHVLCADGSLGWPQHAPYDAIVVAAASPMVPEALLSQLAIGGRLVIPLGPPSWQVLAVVTRRSETDYQQATIEDVCFVPLIGEQGWADEQEQEAEEDEVGVRRPRAPPAA